MTDEPTTTRPGNVIEALALVQTDIGGIRKRTPEEHAAARGQRASERGVSYSYRGIDQIAQHAQPLFGRYGVVITPEVTHHVVDEIIVNSKPWSDTTVTVRWTIYGPGGADDHIHAVTIGMGRDNSDKGYNKAMTGAYKNLLLRLLTIGDPQDDTDNERHETDHGTNTRPPQPPAPTGPFHDRAVTVYQAVADSTDEVKNDVRALSEEFGKRVTVPTLANDEDWLEIVEGLVRNTPEPEPEPEPDEPTEDHTQELADAKRAEIADTVDRIHHPETADDDATPATTE